MKLYFNQRSVVLAEVQQMLNLTSLNKTLKLYTKDADSRLLINPVVDSAVPGPFCK